MDWVRSLFRLVSVLKLLISFWVLMLRFFNRLKEKLFVSDFLLREYLVLIAFFAILFNCERESWEVISLVVEMVSRAVTIV